MVKHFCDRCKYEITDMGTRITYSNYRQIDLCNSCYKDFKKFLEDSILHYDFKGESWFVGDYSFKELCGGRI